MKKILLFSGLAAASFALASCSGNETAPTTNPTEKPTQSTEATEEKGKTIELIYAGDAKEKEFNTQLLDMFKADRKAKGDKNTYVIDYINVSAAEVDSKVVDWGDDNAPDVFEYASDKINTLYKKGALGEVTGKGADFIETSLNKVGVGNATFNNGYYGYTFTGDNTYYLQYDKRLLSDTDVTSFEKIAEKLSVSGKKLGYNLGDAFFSAGLLFTFGADYNITFDENGDINELTADFDGVKGQKAIKAMNKIHQSGVVTYTPAVPSATNGIAGCIAGTWDIANYKTALGENYGCAPMPTITIDGETKNIGAFLGSKLMGVNPQRSTKDKDRYLAAHELAMYLAGEEAQTYRFEKKNIGPCHKEVLKLDAIKQNPNMAVLAKQGDFGHPQGAVPAGIWTAPTTLFDLIKKQDETPFVEADIPAHAKNLNDAIIAH